VCRSYVAVECLDMQVSLFLSGSTNRRNWDYLATLRARPNCFLACFACLNELCHATVYAVRAAYLNYLQIALQC
jgi:hypothetical protein